MHPGREALAATLLTAIVASTIQVAAADAPTRARELFAAHRYGAARTVLEPTLGGSTPAETRLLMARICNRLEDWESGLEHAKAALESLPESSRAQFEYALALRIKMSEVSKVKAMFSLGDYKDALARALELDPNNLDAHEEQIGFLINAPGFAGRDRDRARTLIGELEALDWVRGMRMRAELEQAEDNRAEAGGIFERILERHPDDARTRLRLGFLHMADERWRDADAQFAAIGREAEPLDRFGALYQRGRTRVLGGYEPERAVEFFAAYIESVDGDLLDLPSRSDAYWRQGLAYELLGDPDLAKTAYREALRLDAEHQPSRKALRALGG